MARVWYQGVLLDSRTRDMFERLQWKCGFDLDITQGSYNGGGVAQSAGTHDGGGALDISARGLSEAQKDSVVLNGRKIGLAIWRRRPSQGNWPEHFHGLAIGCPDLSRGAQAQVQAYWRGRNGLASNGADDGPSGYRDVTWENYLAANPLETLMATSADQILATLNKLVNLVQDEAARNVAREKVYANREKVEAGRYTSLLGKFNDVLAQQSLELGRYTDLKNDLHQVKGDVDEVEEKVDALPKA